MTYKPLKVAAAKILFFSVCITVTTYFDEYFLFCVITGNTIFHNSLSLVRDCFIHHVAAFLEATVLKKVRILCVISTITVKC